MSIGERIRKYRERNSLTMKELGEIVHISESMISLYESDKNCPKLETVEKMAAVFNISPSYLMFGDDESTQEYNTDALEILSLLERPDMHDLKMLFKKTGKLSQEDKEQIARILKATLPQDAGE